MDAKYLKETSEQVDKKEQEYTENHYSMSRVYKGLGLTRDALRYYEELGILAPNKNEENNYREYNIHDIWDLLAIDFYKKRGITPKELKQAKEDGTLDSYQEMLVKKKNEIEENIKQQRRMLIKLEDTLKFYETIEKELNLFQIKKFPLYEIEKEISSIINFKEYGEAAADHVYTAEDDIISKMVRVLMTDGKGYTGSKGYFIKKAESKSKGKQYLENGDALYVLIEDIEENGENLMEKMFVLCMNWAKEHGKSFKGMVYLQSKYIYLTRESAKSYLECWVPIA